ncbi:CREB-binding protein-like [Aphidius gifuensis]|uniref:CREB-binding protein-like n=1 Tax=Aphidius gifuensis TaxID=684658 RepID=UPI001CDD2BB6|nr:CREB-binding protein-like [Aphidius gifuensis]
MSSSVSSSYVGGGGDNPPPQEQSKAKKDQLRQALMPSFEKLYRLIPESLPFRQPVDPQALGIPNYFNIVKKPMDLSTIKRKLDAGEYRTPLEYCHDVWLMFDNAWLYNKKTSRVYKDCTTLSEVFAKSIQPVVESHSYLNPQKVRKLSIQRCIQSLAHACQCRDENCCLPSCGKMKRVIKHTKLCKSRTNGGCPICKQLIALCCYHAKHCQETKCLKPFCSNIKQKLKQQQLQQRLQRAQLLRRRMATMNGSQTGAQVNAIQERTEQP